MAQTSPTTERINWQPQTGPQYAALHCPYPEIMFGGARGGGKSDLVLGRAAYHAGLYGQHYNAIIFRIELPQADDLIERARELYEGLARYNQATFGFRFNNGARVRFRPLRTLEDAQKYQGQNLSEAFVEEAGNYPDPGPIMRLFGALRSAHGIPTALFLTGNPGGPGQHWIAQRYVNPAPGGMVPLIQRLEDFQHKAIFIPSKVRDNAILLRNDPAYIAKLHLVGSKELVRAWLDGDWSAIEGSYFDVWENRRHVCRPFEIPDHWLRFRSVDWGSARPFSVGWWAVCSDDTPLGGGVTLPRGALVRHREWYGSKPGASSPNTGQKLTVEQVAAGIVSRSADDPTISYTVADPAMFAEDGGPSMAERMAINGVPLLRADNRRIGRDGAMGGWDMMRMRLIGESDTRPMICTFDTCADSIRTIPMLQHDDKRPEDLNTEQEDHAADEWRYACMSRPWIKDAPEHVDPITEMQKPMIFDDLGALDEGPTRTRL